jgi:hypothetical protein
MEATIFLLDLELDVPQAIVAKPTSAHQVVATSTLKISDLGIVVTTHQDSQLRLIAQTTWDLNLQPLETTHVTNAVAQTTGQTAARSVC